jgi:hypothetical protein
MKVDGFAFTQFDGTVFWDRLAISHRIDEAKDIQWSFKLWSEKKQGSRVAELPGDLQTLVRGKKAAEWSAPERKRLLDWWLENEFQGGREQLDGLRAALGHFADGGQGAGDFVHAAGGFARRTGDLA